MFAYCRNNPVNGCDPCGTCFHNYRLYNCEKCAAALNKAITSVKNAWDTTVTLCKDAYNTIVSRNQQQQAVDTQVRTQQLNMISNAGNCAWNAYQRGYELEQESIVLQAISIVDMFDSPDDVERSLDVIDATVGFSAVAYNFVILMGTVNPPTGALVCGFVGLIWGGRAIIRALQ